MNSTKVKSKKKILKKDEGLKFPRFKKKKKKPNRKKNAKPEQILQWQVEDYLELKGIRYIHIPDEAYNLCNSWRPGTHVTIGHAISYYLKGVPDLLIFDEEGIYNNLLMIELKKESQTRRKNQLEWAEGLNVFECDNFQDAKLRIDKWYSFIKNKKEKEK